MRILLTVFALLFMATTALGRSKPNLVVQIDGWHNDTIFVVSCSLAKLDQKIDTMVAHKGRVVVEQIDQPTMLIMISKSQTVPRPGFPKFVEAKQLETIVLPNTPQRIVGRIEPDRLTYRAQGAPLFAHYAQVRNGYVHDLVQIDSITQQIENARDDSDTGPLFAKLGVSQDKIEQAKRSYIKANPGSELSALYAAQMPARCFMDYYTLLDDQQKSGIFQPMLAVQHQRTQKYLKQLANEKKVTAGTPAPNFTLSSIEGREVSLADFKGKWVVLDFWGSWCSWCIKGIPELKAAYAKYSHKMEVVGIACKDKEASWRAAVAQHNLPWVNLFNNADLPAQYAVGGYPTKILIDPQGVIVHRATGEDPEFYTELDRLLQ